MAHDKDSSFTLLRGALVESERSTIEPSWAGPLVIMEGEPQAPKAAKFFLIALGVPKIDHVGEAHLVESFHVPPTGDRATEGQPLCDEERLHAAACLPVGFCLARL